MSLHMIAFKFTLGLDFRGDSVSVKTEIGMSVDDTVEASVISSVKSSGP